MAGIRRLGETCYIGTLRPTLVQFSFSGWDCRIRGCLKIGDAGLMLSDEANRGLAATRSTRSGARPGLKRA